MVSNSTTTTSQATGSQVLTGRVDFDGKLTKDMPVSYKDYRKIRKDPTINLIRSIVMAPIVSLSWSYEHEEDTPEEAIRLVTEIMNGQKSHIIRTALAGGIDYGWQPYEKLFYVDDEGFTRGKLKPLLQDLTDILVDENTGAFVGFGQDINSKITTIDLSKAMLFSFEVEGTDWYGQSLLENVRRTQDLWDTTNDAAERYDRKIAGTHWKIEYPPGTSPYEGVDKPNEEIARDILKTLQSSGAVIVPRRFEEMIDDFNKSAGQSAWVIDLISDSGSASVSFDTRLRYLDSLKARAFGVPERATLEGQFGTKAEAGEHADLAFANMELRGLHIVEQTNWHFVNQILRINFGKQYENSVRIVQGSLSDKSINFLRLIYQSLLTNPQAFLEEFESIDRRALKERLGIPIDEENIDAEADDTDVDVDGSIPFEEQLV